MTESRRKKKGTWLDRLEHKFGRFAIHNFSKVIAGICIIGTLIYMISATSGLDIYYSYLSLDFGAVLSGQVWRLITFILYPPILMKSYTDIVWVVLTIYVYYILGNAIERAIGAFRFNFFFIIGFLMIIIANILAIIIVPNTFMTISILAYAGYEMSFVYWSMILLYALLYPNSQFLLFFIIPIKAKWVAIFDAAYMGYIFLVSLYDGIIRGMTSELTIAFAIPFSVLNFVIFYLEMRRKSKAMKSRANKFKRSVHVGVKQNSSRHKCCICGRTPEDDPNLQFRYCSKCSGNKEYCSDHLFTHQHN